MDERRAIFRPELLIRLGVLAGVLACALGMTMAHQAADAKGRLSSARALALVDRIVALSAEPFDGELLRDVDEDAHAAYRASALSVPTTLDLRLAHVVTMEVTAYCPCKKCCGPRAAGITASGKTVDYDDGKFVAADTKVLPFGTRVSIPGYHGGSPVEVIDRGGAIKGNKLDVFFESHEAALRWGRRKLAVTILN
jgi:3D (Asp-Asp-Asp) domain-containing protein